MRGVQSERLEHVDRLDDVVHGKGGVLGVLLGPRHHVARPFLAKLRSHLGAVALHLLRLGQERFLEGVTRRSDTCYATGKGHVAHAVEAGRGGTDGLAQVGEGLTGLLVHVADRTAKLASAPGHVAGQIDHHRGDHGGATSHQTTP
ncbi:hypothetical protein D3C85_1198580 [compost metagenome]